MMMDDSPSGNIDNIEISSDDSDDDVLEIISFKKGTDEIEISDDDGNNHKHNRRKSSLRNKLPESSMKKSIESRSSRLRNKNKNRALALQRLKERKHGAYGNLNNNEDESENENSSTVRRYFPDNDDFVVSDSGNEEVYFLTTKWDVKQRKKLYKAFKRLYKFCIAILIHEEYVKKNINELKKAFQIINKRINNVCKKITPVPPWANKFQADIDSFPHFSVNSEYPKTKCDSCRKYITSSFAVSFSGRKYNKVSLKEIKDKPLKDKERVYVIDRVCLERVQIYHELYHFRYNTLKEIKLKMEQNGFRIEEYRKKKDEKKVENVFSELKLNCKEVICYEI
ncbi:hypothetical protein BCR36DRAFT_292452 [Piromyces finnis]|uniref:DUF4211 domain-containing protein n=1 Tax=Piromyces finnis TaxID=1754191 RepID=A0A1Y1V7C0_9FUNG|nr:hypothetical protein BCR36DRAFT_292452 [Piromyces finnis]|eukprot:ORX48959.1 hypothetical protein BCR36DRAFT_292452 [Piromyces finnis]